MNLNLKTSLMVGNLALAGGCAVATEGDEDDDSMVRTTEQEILNGSTDFTNRTWMRDRMVSVNGCSGTLLDGQTVLTARHCVTTTGVPEGDLVAPSSVPVLQLSSPFSTATAASIKVLGSDQDIALVFVNDEDQFSLPSGDVPVTAMEFIQPLAYDDETVYISGLGKDGSNIIPTLRWGRMKVADAWKDSYKGLTGVMTLKMTSADQRMDNGDSGGPIWGTRSKPRSMIAVHSAWLGSPVNRSIETNVSSIRGWVVGQISQDHGRQAGNGKFLPFSSSRELRNTTTKTLGSSAAEWRVANGNLEQLNNASMSLVVWEKLVDRSFVAQTSIYGSDNDGAGIVYYYVDEDNFMYCMANAQQEHVELRVRYEGEDRLLTSAPWTRNWNSSKIMKVTGEGTIYSTCEFDGIKLRWSHAGLMVGAVGVIQDHNQGVRFTYFDYEGAIFEL